MIFFHWIIFFFIIQVVHFLGTYKLYKKAGYKEIYALIPFYNAITLLKIIQRPWWWIFLLFVPVSNNIMFGVLWVETSKTFGKTTSKDAWISVLTLGFYNYYLSFIDYKNLEYNKNRFKEGKPKDKGWFSSLIFAIVAASIIRTFAIEAYVIPTSSMEKTLLVGDFLFVSKLSYGTRVPITQFTAPLVHDTIPLLKVKSYLSFPRIPYMRFPAIEDIDVNDMIVFNYPADMPLVKPIDKKTNYVKRCLGVAGDTLQIKNGIVFLNGKKHNLPNRAKPEFSYHIISEKYPLSRKKLAKKGIKLQRDNFGETFTQRHGNNYIYPRVCMSPKDTTWLVSKYKNIKLISAIDDTPDSFIWPKSKGNEWNADNYGPIYIPKKGKTISLTKNNIDMYKEIIRIYEGNVLKIKNDSTFYINGNVTNKYTFKQNYYWAMGDNRHNSLDSRYWGFVPHNHIVGKPVFIWMSIDSNQSLLNKIRWERLFTVIHGKGKPISFFIPFLILWAGYTAYNRNRKKKKKMADEN